MPRRNRSQFDDWVDLIATFPWWAGAALALVSYLILHQVAGMEIPKPVGTKEIGSMMTRQIIASFAMVGQYFLPAVFLLGAAASAIRRSKRGDLHAKTSGAHERNVLDDMSWREFEQLVGEHFRRRGFSVEETGGGGADGGVDLVLSRASDRYLVQCKQWKARRVGVETVRELYGVMAAERAAGGYVVTSGVFTDEAKRFAEGREIELIDGDRLFDMIRGRRSEPASAGKDRNTASVPVCPQCGAAMILRTARKGSHAGSNFWGCSTWPNCRGKRPA